MRRTPLASPPAARRPVVLSLALVSAGLTGCFDPSGPYVDPSAPAPVEAGAGPEAPPPDGLPGLEKSGPTPPPISGGTLAVEGTIAVVGDPDRDRVLVVDLNTRVVRSEHAAERPGRAIIHGDRGYISLRGEGAVMVLDLARGAVVARHPVCAAPRGLDMAWGQLHVACAGGALVSLDLSGRIVRRLALEPDLRDVVATEDHLHVSRFRKPGLISIDREGEVVAVRAPETFTNPRWTVPSAPTVAWRTIGLPSGWVVMLHQRARTDPISTREAGGYARGPSAGRRADRHFACTTSILTTELTAFPPVGEDMAPRFVGEVDNAVLAVDLAFASGRLMIAAPGNHHTTTWTAARLFFDINDPDEWPDCIERMSILSGRGEDARRIVAIAGSDVVSTALSLDPPALVDGEGRTMVDLGGETVRDPGRALFHTDAGQGLACASCHPEGGEDGHPWVFEDFGPRRTQELRGGLAGTEPFHWTDDIADMQHLMDEVMTRRMGGPEIPPAYTEALVKWIDAQSVPPVDTIATGDPVSGAVLFEDPTVGCAGCHSGPRFSDDRLYDVGTGEMLVTPTLLGIGRRAALMHNGCAATLADRFDPACGGDSHGDVDHLTSDQLDDLIAFLTTL